MSLKNGECEPALAHESMQPEYPTKRQAHGSASDHASAQANGRHQAASAFSRGFPRSTVDTSNSLADEVTHLIPISDGACTVSGTEHDSDSACPNWQGRVISDLPGSFTNGPQEQASESGALISRGSKYSKQQPGRLQRVRYHLQRALQLEGLRR